MRLRKRDLKTVYLRKRNIDKDEEGNDSITYSDDPVRLDMTVQDAGGKVMATIYGNRLDSMKACKYQGDEIKENQNELDGICLYVCKENDPDYEIISIKPFRSHMNIVLEKRKCDGYSD